MGDTTILHRILDDAVSIADDVVVSTNQLFEGEFEEAIEDVAGTRLFVEAQASEAEKPGALGALFQAMETLDTSEDLLVIAGDNLYGFEMAAFGKQVKERDAPTVAVKALDRREDARAFGVVELKDGTRIDAFHEKPDEPPSNLAATALYHYPSGWDGLFDAYDAAARKAEDPGTMFDEPGRILEWAVDQGETVHAWAFEEDWFDIGTAKGYRDALTAVVGDRYVEGTVEGCTEGEGVFVFGDAHAEASSLEETILLPGAHVKDAELSRCIVDSDAVVSGLALADSLVGSHDRLHGTGSS